jgi:NTE family protein
MTIMKAYAVLDGGGVKGAALAGCLSAAEKTKIEFVGYGGTSAGSIVALLACVGYKGDELKTVMTEEVNFTEFLDDDGENLAILRKAIVDIQSASIPKKIWIVLRHFYILNLINAELGLYTGSRLKEFLLRKVKSKLELPSHVNDVTFNDLQTHKNKLPQLKIVASDLRSRKVIVYSAQESGNSSVFDAVRASISYPFVFRPVPNNDCYLVDGGLSSNLPIFLFEKERRQKNLPVIAFDLVSPPRPSINNYGLKHYCGDMLATALESSDALLR